MKNKLSFLTIIIIITCMAGFAFDKFIPTSTVHASNLSHPAVSSAAPVEKETVPSGSASNPVISVVVGFVCVVFGVVAVAPLLVEDQKRAV